MMRAQWVALCALCVGLACWSLRVSAAEPSESLGRQVNFNLELLNLFLWQNDSDFDRSKPAYSKEDQSVGLLGTFARPRLSIELNRTLTFSYEAELGLNLWSRNSAEADVSAGVDALSFKQRQLWGGLRLPRFEARAGIMHFSDVSGLVFNHWFGVGEVRFGYDKYGVRLAGGQMPDQTFEGVQVSKNTFAYDIFAGAVDAWWQVHTLAKVCAGVYFLEDGSVIDRALHLGTWELGVELGKKNGGWQARIVGVLQAGRIDNNATDTGDQRVFGWGVLASGKLRVGRFWAVLDTTLLSADDDSDKNALYSFVWSGKRAGATRLLSENEFFDVGTNFDEQIGAREGWFYFTLAGLFGADAEFGFVITDWANVSGIAGVLTVLNPDRALDASFAGAELGLKLSVSGFDGALEAFGYSGTVIGGKAAAAYVNTLDRFATSPLGFVELGVAMRF